mmetsp:Transcript_4205/g.7447  ORF Transcript_4205/g.7447 Transcript_4205/m.7447 type:complete len:106 (-) Transcript_4205:23-340(-)|eukprot:CAMPEP_0197659236 /NCGR_PEP_ID=MMETSP1338-20131121/46803_1 /TAXON_ID=43686 ORGANISM="Pelagodinium beii, Strain RCC1491" /NCGR_SAMPLE_ID=MMETSP1338 /ASSEMBLY_ACC=CAM_ASM_000754 /LENGTH=105 /DNA_ID=CAMNT_0043236065 /DNA_START=67 /DNA_END=384 /DNA_ORIENTATION=+
MKQRKSGEKKSGDSGKDKDKKPDKKKPAAVQDAGSTKLSWTERIILLVIIVLMCVPWYLTFVNTPDWLNQMLLGFDDEIAGQAEVMTEPPQEPEGHSRWTEDDGL